MFSFLTFFLSDPIKTKACNFLQFLQLLARGFRLSGSQPFVARGTLKSKKNFAAHLYLKNRKFYKKEDFFPKKIKGKVRKKNLAAHLEGAHGTLMCRGTPVEKHWFRV